jgi:hypothetical protein
MPIAARRKEAAMDLLRWGLECLADVGLTILPMAERRLVIPDGFNPGLELEAPEVRVREPWHVCEQEPVIQLVGVAFPLKGVHNVDQAGETWEALSGWRPYAFRGMAIHFPWQQPDSAQWRPATMFEILCARAQHPRAGSYQTSFNSGAVRSITAFWDESGKCAALQNGGREWGFFHHLMFVERWVASDPPTAFCTVQE